MSDYPSVMAAVINYNGMEWLGDCLSGLAVTDYPGLEIVVIDNASRDGSAGFVKEKFSRVKLVENRVNAGFAGAANLAIDMAIARGAKYAVLLNPDIKVSGDWMRELVKAADSDERIAISMPLHYDYDGNDPDPNQMKILSDNPDFVNDRNRGEPKEIYGVNSAIGGCMMIRTDIAKSIGRFDTIYFLYAEDSDFARRAIFHGYKIVVAMNSKIMHWHKILHKDRIDRRTRFLVYRSKFIYLLKDPGKPFLHNLSQYYLNKGSGAWGIINSWAPLSNPRYLALALYTQLWILLHLPVIFFRHFKDKRAS